LTDILEDCWILSSSSISIIGSCSSKHFLTVA
jgi:hypothetical protein